MCKRELEEELRQRKIAMVSAIWSNPNWDSKESNKQQAISEIELSFDRTIAMIWTGRETDDDEEQEIDYENDPFFAAGKRGMEALEVPDFGEAQDGDTMADLVGD